MCVHQYIEDTEQEAMEALQKNEHILRRLAEELLAKTKLSGSVSVLNFSSHGVYRGSHIRTLSSTHLRP